MGYTGWKEDREIDWDKINKDAPAPLEPGIYKLEIAQAEAQASSKGDPMVRILLEAVETVEGDEVNRRKVWDNLTFSDTAAFKAKQLFEALEIDPPGRTGFKVMKEWCKDLLGLEIYAVLVTTTYEGKKNSKVQRYIMEEDLEEELAKLEEGDGDDEDEKPARGRKKKAKKKATKKKAPARARGRRKAVEEEEEEDEESEEETEDLTDDEGADEAEEDEEEEEKPPARRPRGRPARAARGQSKRS